MTAKAGVIRSGMDLDEVAAILGSWSDAVDPETAPDSLDPREHEDANLLLAAQLLVRAARERRTSLGAHYRNDSREETPAVENSDKRYTMSRKASLILD